MSRRWPSIGAMLVAMAWPRLTVAHEFWIEPSTFQPGFGELVEVRLRVGEQFEGDELAHNPRLALRFEVVEKRVRRPLVARPGSTPAGLYRANRAETQTLVYESRPTCVTLEAEKFNAYLVEEGLDEVLRERRRRGELKSAGREAFSRSAKAILGSGRAELDRACGLRLEIVPLVDPRVRTGDDRVPFRVLFEGEPLAGALLVGRAKGREAVLARTDARGRASLVLAADARWLIATVHCFRVSDDPARVEEELRGDVDWESVWASLTFERGEKAAERDLAVER